MPRISFKCLRFYFKSRLIYGEKITNKDGIYKALKHCHDRYGIGTVIVSSSKAFGEAIEEKLVLYASKKGSSKRLCLHCKQTQIFISNNQSILESDHTIEIEFDRLPGIFYGTGDAFAAMVFAWLTRLNHDLKVGIGLHCIAKEYHI